MMTAEFYAFMREREKIRLRKGAGVSREQWTDDPILKVYKFTNVKREHDWTTKTLVKDFYGQNTSEVFNPTMLLMNCVIARFFGLAETAIEIGYQWDWHEVVTSDHIRQVVQARFRRGDSVFTGAYIVPNCGDSSPKHEIVLRVLQEVYSWATRPGAGFTPELSLESFIKALCKAVNGMGSFMAKEVVLDFILVSGWKPSDWDTWTPIGPGARRGAARVEGDGSLLRPLTEPKALEVTKTLYEARHSDELWPPGSVTLELSDIQFQLCEFDKYLRAKRDGGRPKTKYVPRSR